MLVAVLVPLLLGALFNGISGDSIESLSFLVDISPIRYGIIARTMLQFQAFPPYLQRPVGLRTICGMRIKPEKYFRCDSGLTWGIEGTNTTRHVAHIPCAYDYPKCTNREYSDIEPLCSSCFASPYPAMMKLFWLGFWPRIITWFFFIDVEYGLTQELKNYWNSRLLYLREWVWGQVPEVAIASKLQLKHDGNGGLQQLTSILTNQKRHSDIQLGRLDAGRAISRVDSDYVKQSSGSQFISPTPDTNVKSPLLAHDHQDMKTEEDGVSISLQAWGTIGVDDDDEFSRQL